MNSQERDSMKGKQNIVHKKKYYRQKNIEKRKRKLENITNKKEKIIQGTKFVKEKKI